MPKDNDTSDESIEDLLGLTAEEKDANEEPPADEGESESGPEAEAEVETTDDQTEEPEAAEDETLPENTQEEGTEDEEPPEAPPELDALRKQLDELRAELDSSRVYADIGRTLANKPEFFQQQAPAKTAPNPAVMEAVRVILDVEKPAADRQRELSAFPEHVRYEAVQKARQAQRTYLDLATDPESWLAERIMPHVEKVLTQRVAPIEQQFHWSRFLQDNADVIRDKNDYEWIAKEIARGTPANTAVKLLKYEKERSAFSAKQQMVVSKERDNRSTQKARRSAASRTPNRVVKKKEIRVEDLGDSFESIYETLEGVKLDMD